MPELPEVYTIRDQLQEKIAGKTITDIRLNNPKVIKEPAPKIFKESLMGRKIINVKRRAKVLIIELKGSKFLIVHLRISGWFLYGKEEEKARIVFRLSNGKFLNYMDQRLLGELRLRKSFEDLKFIKELGPEPFDVSLDQFKDILGRRKARIKTLLLDQKIISGIGNIYAQEALFLAKIDPRRASESLKKDEVKVLHKKIISVLKEAIKYKGSSVDIFRGIEGNKGGMGKRLKVYNRKGQPCLVCKKPIAKIFLGARGTCFCSHCQR